jgi:hypothetical protein
MAESFFVGTIASCVVTELIKVVIKCSQAAVRCKSECKKLQQELVIIVPDVERIEKRLAAVREANRGDAHEDVQMVADWLRRLKDAIDGAKADVYRCNSGRFSLDQHKLSVRLASQYNVIMNLAHQRQSLFLQLRNLMPVPPQGMSHPPQNWCESPGASVLRRMTEERTDALWREEVHRQSMNAASSLHNGWGYGSGGHESNESSSHGGYRSEADSSGHGGDSPGTYPLRQRTQQGDNILLQQAEGERAQLLRRHPLASAYGHDPEPAYDKWKY